MVLSDLPGYTRGIARMRRLEDVLRARAMTRLPEQINGRPVRRLTPRMLDLLVLINSVFLVSREVRLAHGIEARPEDVAQFLWIVSIDNPLDGSKPDDGFFASLRPDEPEYFRGFYAAIDSYYKRAMLDRPAAGGGQIVATAISAAIVHRIASAYGWADEVFDKKGRPVQWAGVLDIPLDRSYQYWRWIVTDRDPSSPQFSRFQDAFRKKCILKWRRRAVAAGFGGSIENADVRGYLKSREQKGESRKTEVPA